MFNQRKKMGGLLLDKSQIEAKKKFTAK